MPKYDVIIPAYNTPKEQLDVTIKSMLNNAYYDLNIIVINKPQSVVENKLEGLKQATSDIIFMADDDIDIVTKNWDKIMIDALEDPTIGCVGANIIDYSNMKSRFGDIRRDVHNLRGALIAYKRDDSKYQWDNRYLGSQYDDTDFCFQLKFNHNLRSVYLGDVKCMHLHTAKNINWENRNRFIEKWGIEKLNESLKDDI